MPRRMRLGCWHFWRDRSNGWRRLQMYTNACRQCRLKHIRGILAKGPPPPVTTVTVKRPTTYP